MTQVLDSEQRTTATAAARRIISSTYDALKKQGFGVYQRSYTEAETSTARIFEAKGEDLERDVRGHFIGNAMNTIIHSIENHPMEALITNYYAEMQKQPSDLLAFLRFVGFVGAADTLGLELPPGVKIPAIVQQQLRDGEKEPPLTKESAKAAFAKGRQSFDAWFQSFVLPDDPDIQKHFTHAFKTVLMAVRNEETLALQTLELKDMPRARNGLMRAYNGRVEMVAAGPDNSLSPGIRDMWTAIHLADRNMWKVILDGLQIDPTKEIER